MAIIFINVSCSPRKKYDRNAIWGNIVFWRMEISNASNFCNALFHIKNARAVLTTPSQMIMPQPEGETTGNSSNEKAPTTINKVPKPIGNAVNSNGFALSLMKRSLLKTK